MAEYSPEKSRWCLFEQTGSCAVSELTISLVGNKMKLLTFNKYFYLKVLTLHKKQESGFDGSKWEPRGKEDLTSSSLLVDSWWCL